MPRQERCSRHPATTRILPLRLVTRSASGDTLLVGDQYADGTSGTSPVHSAGLVHQLSLTTGNIIRTINSPVPIADDRIFGNSISITGNSVVVGTYTNSSGNIHAFNLTTGNLINTFNNPAARHVYSTAIGHGELLIGEPDFSLGSGNERSGIVWSYDAKTESLEPSVLQQKRQRVAINSEVPSLHLRAVSSLGHRIMIN